MPNRPQSARKMTARQPGVETHPFAPFLPSRARVLFMGTFPAGAHRWSMEFYYPNFLNDFWRVMGLLYFGEPGHFERRPAPDGKNRWNEGAIRQFCASRGLAFSDTAEQIRRLAGNASDASLEVVRARDVDGLLAQLPVCAVVAATGKKAAEVLAELFGVAVPLVGGQGEIRSGARRLQFWRLPSTSRAYPLPLPKKAAPYAALLRSLGLL